MSDDDPRWPADVRNLQELFVEVTGEQTFTDAQADARGRGVINTTAGGAARPEDVESDLDERRTAISARADVFGDAIDAGPDVHDS